MRVFAKKNGVKDTYRKANMQVVSCHSNGRAEKGMKPVASQFAATVYRARLVTEYTRRSHSSS